MKKLVFVFAVALGASMVACSGSAETTDNAAAADSVEAVVEEAVVETVDSVAADSAVVDSAAAVVAEVAE